MYGGRRGTSSHTQRGFEGHCCAHAARRRQRRSIWRSFNPAAHNAPKYSTTEAHSTRASRPARWPLRDRISSHGKYCAAHSNKTANRVLAATTCKAKRAQPGWGRFALKLLVALGVMGVALWFASGPTSLWTEIGGLERGLRLALIVLGGAVAYFATLFALGFRPRDFRRRGAA